MDLRNSHPAIKQQYSSIPIYSLDEKHDSRVHKRVVLEEVPLTNSREEEYDKLLQIKGSQLVDEAALEDREFPRFGFLYFGMVGMLCFNFFLQVANYLNCSFNTGFVDWAVALYGFANNIGQLIAVFTGSRFRFFPRVWISSIGLAIVVVGFPVLSYASVSFGSWLAYGLALGMGLCTSLMQSAGFGLAGSVSVRAIHWYSLGQGLAGVLALPLLLALEYMYTCMGLEPKAATADVPSAVDGAASLTMLVICAVCTLCLIPYYYFGLSRNRLVAAKLEKLEATLTTHSLAEYTEGIVHTLPMATCVWFVMFVTFLAFPSRILSWKSPSKIYSQNFFISVNIYLFAIFDVVGRWVAVAGVSLSQLAVWASSPWRIFIVLVMYLSSYEVWWFGNDVVRVVLVVALAFTNGYFINWCMMLGPQGAKNPDIASYTMSFFLVNGILCGSLVCVALDSLIRRSTNAAIETSNDVEGVISVGAVALETAVNAALWGPADPFLAASGK